MNCIKKMTLTGYNVQYVDLREPKPRTIREEVYAADRDWLEAVALLGMNVADTIKARYERGGYKALSVDRIAGKRLTSIDLGELWKDAESSAPTLESEVTPNADCK